ncbi:glycosidase [Sphingobacterium allocomposti]|uniref:Glycosidase n=1 Tax=Sphingobacterium allocomposti TaxID=415956 RepID=A0A5S5DSJ2_9SPHI|nr:glycoside hydrolase family 13 protein [Sphingobacterium composti Yoo et al. 2007 non Ten et al. 2007]TYP97822.1 glycosidase [Sphingobacterium composti Yoo et al. 2007 non Ten et al. 2007]
MNLKRILISACLIVWIAFAQGQSIQRAEPLHWWVGMHNPELQIILYGTDIGDCEVKLPKAGMELKRVHRVENKNYLFLDVAIQGDAQAGIYPIELYKGGRKVLSRDYILKDRDRSLVKAQGVNAADLIYLIMPDRFANGDPSNDSVKGMRETAVNRDSMYYRHGGDIQGIINNLDYLEDLGVTALWMTPVLTNDMPKASYHGYANTENYQIDPRFGTVDTYRELGKELHKRKMKLIHDVVPNHVGLHHWTVLDRPSSDWLHESETFTQTTYKDQTMFDPYGTRADKDFMEKGWFVETMPDMNHQNEKVQKYITQSHIWWIEEAGVDGFRIDTYPYNDLTFMGKWKEAIRSEYPRFTFFGETWVQSVANQAYFLGGQKVGQQIDTKLEGVTDFQLTYAIGDALNQEKGGAERLYHTVSGDYLYPNPMANVIFLDNHDKDRFFSTVGEHLEKYKSAFSWLLTYRGIPQMYYGAEILMKNFSRPDGLVRDDFKGGFPGDEVNKFTAAGRTDKENEMFNHVRTLAQYRKRSRALQHGKMTHYVPQNDVYVYFRYEEDERVMVIMNCSDEEREVGLARFTEGTAGAKTVRNILTGESSALPERVSLHGRQTVVLELR